MEGVTLIYIRHNLILIDGQNQTLPIERWK
jgi:hypothetical protein